MRENTAFASAAIYDNGRVSRTIFPLGSLGVSSFKISLRKRRVHFDSELWDSLWSVTKKERWQSFVHCGRLFTPLLIWPQRLFFSVYINTTVFSIHMNWTASVYVGIWGIYICACMFTCMLVCKNTCVLMKVCMYAQSCIWGSTCGFLYIHASVHIQFMFAVTPFILYLIHSHREIFNLWSVPLFFNLFLSLFLSICLWNRLAWLDWC